MKLTIKDLENCFTGAVIKKAKYIGVKVQMEGFEEPEIIINLTENFETKSFYYNKAYNKDLSLKSYNCIKITGVTYGNSYFEIQEDLNGI